MSHRSVVIEAGVLRAAELDLVGRVFAQTSARGETEGEREQRASRILAYFTAGIRDEAELRELVSRPLGR